MTIIRPAPGVMSGFYEYGCGVVDTRNDRWLHFEGDRAWIWESVRVTGSASHLDPEDVPHLDFFIKAGLMLTSGTREPVEAEPVVTGPRRTAVLYPCTPWMIRRAWNQSLRLSRLPMIRTLDLIGAIRARPTRGYPSRRSVERLRSRILTTPTRWPHRKIHPDGRTLSVATVLIADLANVRIDLGFGMRYGSHEPAWWCSTPEGPVGRPDRCLGVATV